MTKINITGLILGLACVIGMAASGYLAAARGVWWLPVAFALAMLIVIIGWYRWAHARTRPPKLDYLSSAEDEVRRALDIIRQNRWPGDAF